MKPSPRWTRIAEALASHRYDDAVEHVTETVFGDFPPLTLVRQQFATTAKYRLWRNKMEKTWNRWMEGANLPQNDKFFLTKELSNVYHLELETKKAGKRRKYRRKAR